MNQRSGWATLTLLIFTAVRTQALTDAEKCEAAKNKIAGKYAFCRQKAEAKGIKSGSAPDYSQCDAKFGLKWGVAESNGGGMCPTNGDELPMQMCVTAHTERVAAALSGGTCQAGALPETGQTQCDQGDGTLGLCPGSPAAQDGALQPGVARAGTFVDNGDGTILDTVTGLMWEKLSDDGSIHDKDDPYQWSDAFTTKVAALNSGGGFAGHTDWRLPTVTEQLTIVNYGKTTFPALYDEFSNGCVPGCTVTTCSCESGFEQWSSTTSHRLPTAAWALGPNSGESRIYFKADLRRVRAARGGA